VSKPREARDLLLKAVRKYKAANNSEFANRRWAYFDNLVSESNTNSFQLAMLWASVGNTMPSMFWLLYYLLCDAECMAKVMQEIRSVIASNSGSCEPGARTRFTQEMLNQMTYIDCCLTETLRLSSGSIIMRHVVETSEITLSSGKSYTLRKGDRIGLCPPLWHNDPELYPNPSKFDPERWVLAGDQYTSDEIAFASVGRLPAQQKGGKMLPP
jgi:cytochrome P450